MRRRAFDIRKRFFSSRPDAPRLLRRHRFFLAAAGLIAASWAVLIAVVPAAGDSENDTGHVRVIEHTLPAPLRSYLAGLEEKRPPMPGYRAAVTIAAGEAPWPYMPPGAEAPPRVRQAYEHVCRRLAADGLLSTTAEAIRIIGVEQFSRGEQQDAELLKSVGLPVDLLRHFHVPGASEVERYPVLRWIMQQVMQDSLRGTGPGGDGEMKARLSAAAFRFIKSEAAFRAAADSGEAPIEMFRAQLPRGDYWRGMGDGSGVDVARQLLDAARDARFVFSMDGAAAHHFRALSSLWPFVGKGRVTVISEEVVVSQWTADNGRAGRVERPGEGRRLATLVPRYASRGEEGTVLVPGDSFIPAGLEKAGQVVVASPLLFQGGNLLLGVHPLNGWRYLLIGEAEIYRNMALGLSRPQVEEAFKAEFDADLIVVLPAASYHIDYEVSLRSVGDRILAFVNDTEAAVDIILAEGVDALRDGGMIDEADAARLKDQLRGGRRAGCAVELLGCVDRLSVGPGQYPESLARRFATSPVESGVANLQHFLLAIDLALASAPEGIAAVAEPGSAHHEYLSTFRRREADRAAIRRRLEELRFAVTPVPSLSDAERSVNYVNGIHGPGVYYMPAAGGFHARLDEAAMTAFSTALDPGVRVVPIFCGESERRSGGVRCAVAAYRGPASGGGSPQR